MTRNFVKRTVGLPGETIRIRNKKVYANEENIVFEGKERFTRSGYNPFYSTMMDNYGPEVLPPDNYFMMGDNRDRSQGSRSWGPLDRKLVRGKALFVTYSMKAKEKPGMNRENPASDSIFKRIRWKRFFNVIR